MRQRPVPGACVMVKDETVGELERPTHCIGGVRRGTVVLLLSTVYHGAIERSSGSYQNYKDDVLVLLPSGEIGYVRWTHLEQIA